MPKSEKITYIYKHFGSYIFMKKIVKLLKDLQKDYNIRILFAVESGSRAWRMDSKNSDYDVRFVYSRDLKEYLKIDKSRDVISRTVDDIDIVGFDLYKFCGLLKASNPSVIEWLISDIVYFKEQPKELVEFANIYYNNKALFWHYKSMCKSNYIKYIQSKEGITYKRYLYAMRGLINSLYVSKRKQVPPIDFLITIEEMKEDIPAGVYKTLKDIIRLKKQGKEKDIVKNIVRMDRYIEKYLKDKNEPDNVKKILPIGMLNDFCYNELCEV